MQPKINFPIKTNADKKSRT